MCSVLITGVSVFQSVRNISVYSIVMHFRARYVPLMKGVMAEKMDGWQGEVVGTHATLHHLKYLGTI